MRGLRGQIVVIQKTNDLNGAQSHHVQLRSASYMAGPPKPNGLSATVLSTEYNIWRTLWLTSVSRNLTASAGMCKRDISKQATRMDRHEQREHLAARNSRGFCNTL